MQANASRVGRIEPFGMKMREGVSIILINVMPFDDNAPALPVENAAKPSKSPFVQVRWRKSQQCFPGITRIEDDDGEDGIRLRNHLFILTEIILLRLGGIFLCRANAEPRINPAGPTWSDWRGLLNQVAGRMSCRVPGNDCLRGCHSGIG